MNLYKVIYVNKIIFKDVIAITLIPIIFILKEHKGDKELIRHEEVHMWQQIEIGTIAIAGLISASIFLNWSLWLLPLFPLLFYAIYLLEAWIRGYGNTSFELESYNIGNKVRKPFGWIKYWRKNSWEY